MKTLFKIGALCVLSAVFASAAGGQCTTSTVTGTFKTPSGLTPAQAGLDAGETIATVATYGRLEFTPWDSSAKKAVRLICGAISIGPQAVVAWIKSDGTAVPLPDRLGWEHG